MPALLFARALKAMNAGERIVAEATDGLAELDLQNEALKGGHVIEEVGSENGIIRVVVRIRDGA